MVSACESAKWKSTANMALLLVVIRPAILLTLSYWQDSCRICHFHPTWEWT